MEEVAWRDFERREPQLATRVRESFERHRHAVLGTLKQDGSPRLSGLEAPIRDGHLWLGTSSATRIASDLRRDPRFALHSSLDEEHLPQGDSRVHGVALAATNREVEVFVAGSRFPIPDPATIALFVANIVRVVHVRVAGNRLEIDNWTPATGRNTLYRV